MFGAVLVMEEGRPALPVAPDLLIGESSMESFEDPVVVVMHGAVGSRMRKSLVGPSSLAGACGEFHLRGLMAARLELGWQVKHFSTCHPDTPSHKYRFSYTVGKKRHAGRILAFKNELVSLGESTGLASVMPGGALSVDDKKNGGFAFAMAGKVHRVSGPRLDDLVITVADGSPEKFFLDFLVHFLRMDGLSPEVEISHEEGLDGLRVALQQQDVSLRHWAGRNGLVAR